MTFTLWLSLLSISLLGAMSPGPSLAMVAKHSIAGGRSNGIATGWAHASGIAIYAFLTVFGLAVVLQHSPIVFKTISGLGALYLMYLGWNALRSKGGVAEKLEAGKATSLLESARDGFLISILNPKIGLFFIALFSQFITPTHSTSQQLTIISTPFIVDGSWYTLVALLLSNVHFIDKIKRKAVWIDRVSGMVLILLALKVLFTLVI